MTRGKNVAVRHRRRLECTACRMLPGHQRDGSGSITATLREVNPVAGGGLPVGAQHLPDGGWCLADGACRATAGISPAIAGCRAVTAVDWLAVPHRGAWPLQLPVKGRLVSFVFFLSLYKEGPVLNNSLGDENRMRSAQTPTDERRRRRKIVGAQRVRMGGVAEGARRVAKLCCLVPSWPRADLQSLK